MIRDATAADAAAIAAIYGGHVVDGVATFEEVAPDADEMARRIAAVTDGHPWLVWDGGDGVAGYAYASRFHARGAYRWTVETTVYLAPQAQGRGIGTRLYAELLDRLTAQGFVTAIACVTLPNAASAALHERLGFAFEGARRGVGFKHGAWHDVGYWQRDLAPRTLNPGTPAAPDRGRSPPP